MASVADRTETFGSLGLRAGLVETGRKDLSLMNAQGILAKLREILGRRPATPPAAPKFAAPPMRPAEAPYTFTDPVTKHQRDDYWRSR